MSILRPRCKTQLYSLANTEWNNKTIYLNYIFLYMKIECHEIFSLVKLISISYKILKQIIYYLVKHSRSDIIYYNLYIIAIIKMKMKERDLNINNVLAHVLLFGEHAPYVFNMQRNRWSS